MKKILLIASVPPMLILASIGFCCGLCWTYLKAGYVTGIIFAAKIVEDVK